MSSLWICFLLILSTTSVSRASQTFLIRPANVTATVGETVSLECRVGNQAQTGRTQWTKDGFALGFDYRLPGFPRHSVVGDHSQGIYNLRVEGVKLEDDGEYECQVLPMGDIEGIRSFAYLSVMMPPSSVTLAGRRNGATIEVRMDSNLNVDCQTDGSKPAADMRWYKNGKLVESGVETRVTPVEEGKLVTSAQLSLVAQPNDHQAVFTCQVLHAALPANSALRANFTLAVMYPPGVPEVSGYVDGQILKAGDRLKLQCQAENGNPPPELIWMRNGRRIDSSYHRQQETTRNDYEFVVDPSDNEAEYKCEALNSASVAPLSSAVRLKVFYPPTRVFIDGNLQAKVGDVVALTCRSAASHPPARLNWLIDGKPMLNPPVSIGPVPNGKGFISTSNVTVRLSQERRDVTISCAADNEELSDPAAKVTKTVTIAVQYPPESISIYGYEGVAIPSGNTQKLTCVCLGGNPLATIQWFRAKKRIVDGIVSEVSGNIAQSELTVEVTPEDNRAEYTCRGKNAASDVPLEASTTLLVNYLPQSIAIRQNPDEFHSGQPGSLLCQTSAGNPLPEVSWFRNGKAVDRESQELLSNKTGTYGGWEAKSRLKLQLTSDEDGVEYECRAESSILDKSISDKLKISVSYPPHFLIANPQVVSVLEGESVSVNATASGNPDEIQYKWRKDGRLLIGQNLDAARIKVDGPQLLFTSAKRTDSGVYLCEATNAEGSSNLTLTISVKYPAGIVRTSDLFIYDVGDSVELECEAEANPRPTGFLHWERPDYDMSRVEQFHDGNTKSFLKIPRVERNDSGLFYCVANNGVGQTDRRPVAVLVKQPPRINTTRLYMKAAGRKGENAILVCLAQGAPEVEIFWSKSGGSNVQNSTKHFSTTIKTGPIDYKGELVVNNIDSTDFGHYECSARNILGEAKTQVHLAETSPPEPPTALEVLNVTQDSVSLTWTPGFNGGLRQHFRLRFQKVGYSGYLYSDVPTTGENVFTVSNLSPQTKYLFSLASYNDLGTSGYPQTAKLVTTAGAIGAVRREGLPSGPLLEIVVGSLAAGLILLVINVAILVFFIRRRQRRKLAEKAASTRLVDPARHVQMYASTEATGGANLRPESQYTAEPSDNEQAGHSELSDNDDNNSVRTVIEVDSAGHPVFAAAMNGAKPHSPAYGDLSYAETLRANSLQRRIASGMYSNSGYQDSNGKLPSFGAKPPQPQLHHLESPLDGGVPPAMAPLRSLSQELNSLGPYQLHYQPANRANMMIKRYSPESGAGQPQSNSGQFGSVGRLPGGSPLLSPSGSLARPGGNGRLGGFSAPNPVVTTSSTSAIGPGSYYGRNSPILSTFAAAQNNRNPTKTDYVDVKTLEGDLV